MDEQVLQAFLTHSRETLSQIDAGIASVARDANQIELPDEVLRTFRGLKETCGFLGLTALGSAARSAETRLAKIQNDRHEVASETLAPLLATIDEIKALLRELEGPPEERGAADSPSSARPNRSSRTGQTQKQPAEKSETVDPGSAGMPSNAEPLLPGRVQNRRQVLVVEDSLFFRKLVTAALETEHYHVTAADSSLAAIEQIEEGEHFDAIVSDLEMPRMNGCQFAHWLRSRPGTGETPLIALSATKDESSEGRALDAGFDRLLEKFSARELIDAIEDLCRRPSNKRAAAMLP